MTDLKSIGFSSHRKASSYAGGLQKFDICVKKRKSPIRELLKVTRNGDLLNDRESRKHTRWGCKSHIVFFPKYAAKLHRESFLARGYFVSTVGRDEKSIREYIKNQEQEDQRIDQLSMFSK